MPVYGVRRVRLLALQYPVDHDPEGRQVLAVQCRSFEVLRPFVIACVEAFPPAIRSTVLRQRLAAGYARGRDAGNQMLTRAFTEQGLEVPAALAALPSVIIALCDGLMLQWLADPASTPSAAHVLDALEALAPVLEPGN